MADDFEYKPVRPVLRVAAVCLGLFFLAVCLILIFQLYQSFSWSLMRLLFLGMAIGTLFTYVGITGTNFYAWLKKKDDEQH